jgi:CRP-like cAMP-binding protein
MTEPQTGSGYGLPDPADLAADPAFVEHAARTLGSSELAEGLTPQQIARLAAVAQVRQYHPGELVVDEHERSDELYLIDAGSLEVWLDPASVGRPGEPDRRIAELQAGQTCGELALLDGGVRSARVRAGVGGARLTVFASGQLLAICQADTAIGFRIMRNLAGALALRLRLQDMRLYSE